MKFDLVIVVGVDHAAESVFRGVGKQLWACDFAPLLREFQHPSTHMVRSAARPSG